MQKLLNVRVDPRENRAGEEDLKRLQPPEQASTGPAPFLRGGNGEGTPKKRGEKPIKPSRGNGRESPVGVRKV